MYVEGTRITQNPLLQSMGESVRRLLENADLTCVEEIRLRRNMPLTLHFGRRHTFVNKNGAPTSRIDGAYIVTAADIERSMELLCNGSVYSFQDEIRQGYITAPGGHRVGIAGRAVLQNGCITHIKDISGLNFRFARQIIGAADKVMSAVLLGGGIKNTLIVSPPACGKTTMLRDIARQVSNGGFKTVIVDERSEIASMSGGVCGYDVGALTDVLDGCPKAVGMMMAIRSMSPQLIVCDEIGDEADIRAVRAALECGVSVAASVHGRNAAAVFADGQRSEMAELFEVFVTLGDRCGSGTVESVLTGGQLRRDIRTAHMGGG